MADFTLAVMAGGQSSRMGTDKAFVLVGARTMIEHVLTRTAGLPDRAATIIIANRPDDYVHLGYPVQPDVMPGKGALGGIYTALHHSATPYTLVIACDMPLVQPALLRYMLSLRGAGEDSPDVIMPRVEGYPQGLLALYGQGCRAPIRADIEADRLKVIGFHDRVRVRYLDEAEYAPYDPDGRSFFNANTPDDVAQAASLLAAEADSDNA